MDWADLVTPATGLVAGLGIGSVLTNYIQYRLDKREQSFASHRTDLENRYRVIILLMYAAYDFDVNATSLRINRPDLTDQTMILEELKAEWFNMLLFASHSTQRALHEFILNPSSACLKKTASCMRNDLGRENFKASIDDLEF